MSPNRKPVLAAGLGGIAARKNAPGVDVESGISNGPANLPAGILSEAQGAVNGYLPFAGKLAGGNLCRPRRPPTRTKLNLWLLFVHGQLAVRGPDWVLIYQAAEGHRGYSTTRQAADAEDSSQLLLKDIRAGESPGSAGGIHRLERPALLPPQSKVEVTCAFSRRQRLEWWSRWSGVAQSSRERGNASTIRVVLSPAELPTLE